MNSLQELHYVVVVKQGHICSVEAGPFISSERAEAIIPVLPEISKSCRYMVAMQEVHLTVKD